MSHRLQVLIPERLDLRVRKAALRERVTKGEWVRRALEKALSDPAGSPDPLGRLASLGAPTADIDQMIAEIESGRS
jgi:hypothetical protein